MEWLVDIASSSGLGSIVGVVGGFAQKFVDLKAKRLEYGFEKRMRELDLEEASGDRAHQISMADKQMELAETEGDIKIETREVDAFVASQEHSGKNNWLTLIRACITIYLLSACSILSAVIWYKVGGLDAFSELELVELLNYIVRTAFFLLVTCVTWWFAARPGNLKFKR